MIYKNHCRTCLGSNIEMRNIYHKIKISGQIVSFIDILQNFYEYKINPSRKLPANICINCAYQLTLTFSFKVLIDSCADKLAASLQNLNEDPKDCCYDSEADKPLIRFKESEFLEKHETCRESNLIFCVKCQTQFKSVKLLKEHCVINHSTECALGRECDYCNEKFEDFKSLVQHRKMHSTPFLCKLCWEGFTNELDLKSHLCKPLPKEDKNEKSLKQCDQCGKSYQPGYISVHMLTHSKNKPYKCKYCSKSFKVPAGLHSHILWNHKRTRNHKCEVCNATFISSSSRSSHVRKYHLKEKKYLCESCYKRFFSKSELQRHSLTHTGIKNFHCNLCQKSYQTRYGLNVHLKSHHQTQSVVDL